MTESSEDKEKQSDDSSPKSPLRAAPEDLAGLDFEAPIAGSNAADAAELAEFYRIASDALSSNNNGKDSPVARVWDMLWGLTGMYFKPAEQNEPFGPICVRADGMRSAIPSDFRSRVDMLETMARAASNVVLKARLCDLVWLLDRKRSSLGVEAIDAYIEIVRLSENGTLKFGYASQEASFHPQTRDYLLRAFGIARTLGWKRPQSENVQKMILQYRKRAFKARAPLPVLWFSDLDLLARVSNPGEVAVDVEAVIADLPAGTDYHIVVDLWHLSARAYHLVKRSDDDYRCQIQAAETMVAAADKLTSAMLASQIIGNAIAALHGVPSAKERRRELHHKLIDVQDGISDEMTTFSQEFDLSELAKSVSDELTPLSLLDCLFAFAALDASPDPVALHAEASKAVRQSLLSALFGMTHHDDEGKVIYRTDRGVQFGSIDDSAIRQQVAQAERNRRFIVVSGMIEPARDIITNTQYLSDDVFVTVFQYSPFVPPDLVRTFARGFARFFQGDFTSALYILTPLLENSLRYVLKTEGHDVTIFDDATKTQKDRSISSLFEQMRAELDAVFTRPITEDIDRVFLAKPGPYLRHAVAHGLLRDGDPYRTDSIYGCWLIFRLCLIPLFSYREELGLV